MSDTASTTTEKTFSKVKIGVLIILDLAVLGAAAWHVFGASAQEKILFTWIFTFGGVAFSLLALLAEFGPAVPTGRPVTQVIRNRWMAVFTGFAVAAGILSIATLY